MNTLDGHFVHCAHGVLRLCVRRKNYKTAATTIVVKDGEDDTMLDFAVARKESLEFFAAAKLSKARQNRDHNSQCIIMRETKNVEIAAGLVLRRGDRGLANQEIGIEHWGNVAVAGSAGDQRPLGKENTWACQPRRGP